MAENDTGDLFQNSATLKMIMRYPFAPYSASGFMRFHVGAEQGVDPGLIPRPFGLEPI